MKKVVSAGYDLDRITRYSEALPLYEQSLAIYRETGDRPQEAITSWNIGIMYKDKGDLTKAEQYISRTVLPAEAIGHHPKPEEWRKALEAVRAALQDGTEPSSRR